MDLPAGAVRRAFGDVTRWHCPDCGSPVAARFEYLPGQLFVPLGVIEEMDGLAPSLHCHSHKQAPWLHLDDGLPRSEGSGRDELNRRAGVDEG